MMSEKLALVRELAHEREVRQKQTVMVATLVRRIRNLESEVNELQQRAQSATDSEADCVGGNVDASDSDPHCQPRGSGPSVGPF